MTSGIHAFYKSQQHARNPKATLVLLFCIFIRTIVYRQVYGILPPSFVVTVVYGICTHTHTQCHAYECMAGVAWSSIVIRHNVFCVHMRECVFVRARARIRILFVYELSW